MFHLDLRSIILMSGIMSLLLSVVFLLMQRSYPIIIRGLGQWAAAPVIIFVSTLLFGARGVLPDLLTVIVANLLLLSGIALIHVGSQRFFGVPLTWRFWMGAILATVPVLSWYTLVEPNYDARLLVVLFLWGWMMLAHARLILRHGGKVFVTRFTVVILLIQAGVIGLRFMAALLLPVGGGLFDGSLFQTLYIVTNALMILTLFVGLLLMATDRLRAEFEHLATHDTLTGVLTRRTLLDICGKELERCRRHGRTMSLLIMDLDNFKVINDTYGHQMGDRVLVDFVARISPLLRRPDGLGRYGGEEFVVMLPETSLEEALAVAERIRSTVESPVSGLPPVTVSIGVTCNRPDDAQVDVLLARADKALYKAKAMGRNCVATT